MTPATDDLADIAGWRMGLDIERTSMLRASSRMPIDSELRAALEEAAARVEQAIDELDRAAEPLAHEVNRIECAAERKHERESAPIVL